MTDAAHEKYTNDYIGEVFCQVFFDVPASWTPAAYGLVLDKIRDLGFETAQDMGFMPQPPEARQVPPILMRFGNSAGTTLIQVSPFLFSINHVKPYPGWETFRPVVLEAMARCSNVVEPTVFKQFGLRYINRIRIPADKRLDSSAVPIADWLTIYPTLPDSRKPYNVCTVQCQWLVQDDHLLAVGVSRDLDLPAEEFGFVLDLGYTVNLSPNWSLDHLEDLLETSHDAIYALFEECITDKTRSLLKELKPHE